MAGREQFAWCESLYEAKAAELILYGRALGLTHGESEDVLQETFLALMQMVWPAPGKVPLEPEHYCVRSFRNRALNHRRSLWRRLTRELESLRWFEKSPGESEAERAAMDCLAALPVEQREAIVLKIWHRFTFEEIGGLLNVSPNTAAGRYRYGLQKIKKRLEMPWPTKNYSLSPPGRGEGHGEGILYSPPHPVPLRFAAERENLADVVEFFETTK